MFGGDLDTDFDRILKDREFQARTTPTHAQRANSDMLTAAMTDMTPAQLFDAVEAHLEARPDIDPADLEAFSNRLRRQAWKRERDA